MLQLVEHNQVGYVRDALRAIFERKGKKLGERRLTTPGGAFDADLVCWPKNGGSGEGLWAYFLEKAWSGNRLPCGFGSFEGEDFSNLTPSVEMNFSFDPENRRVSTRALRDDAGNFYIGHRGGLGGGRASVSSDDFSELIRGFVREKIIRSDQKEEHVFIIGAITSQSFLPRLFSYVKECERIRTLAKNGKIPEDRFFNIRKLSGADNVFNRQNGSNGIGVSSGTYDINRLHGRVVNALADALGAAPKNSMHDEMRPDLYIMDKYNKMKVLFEVKVSSDTQSWFTALGQLVVYGAGQTPRPKRILVCPANREDPNFKRAIEELSVSVVTFTIDDDDCIIFDNIDVFKD
ncbi:hypothetical protein HL658_26570 [Azospirillum sp. RWY-5-1]|uniref:Restriction endonuclease n=1 Tax=Azospirillum oleiclasticum TaxID=2735135 RepID=A0ABX2TI63_9PROT|nr:hypothetical protein [Azospirillum oleiclasticum]NYZ16120.1 hypothetical protein [Azospirillum oleiclasticum]NYZ23001.1 hypothetical protein [Azospirillum oleiclasticum]